MKPEVLLQLIHDLKAEVMALRQQNAALTNALKAAKEEIDRLDKREASDAD